MLLNAKTIEDCILRGFFSFDTWHQKKRKILSSSFIAALHFLANTPLCVHLSVASHFTQSAIATSIFVTPIFLDLSHILYLNNELHIIQTERIHTGIYLVQHVSEILTYIFYKPCKFVRRRPCSIQNVEITSPTWPEYTLMQDITFPNCPLLWVWIRPHTLSSTILIIRTNICT